MAGYLLVLKDLYRLRSKLQPDALGFDPFPYTSAGLVAGVSRATRGAIPFIPDAVALDLMSKALHWVERETDGILEQRDRFWSVFNTARSRGVTLHYCGKLGRDSYARASGNPMRQCRPGGALLPRMISIAASSILPMPASL